MEKHDVIVIGSGCGGAPAAGRLAEAGADVCVLERGIWWGQARGNRPFPKGYLDFVKSIRALGLSLPVLKKYIPLNLRSGLLEFYFVNGYLIVIPCGVGGGSLVIGGFIDRPPADIYDHYPEEITPAEMEPYFERVASVVGPAVAPKETWYEKTVVGACARVPGITAVPQPTSMWYGSGPDAEETRLNDFGVEQHNCQYHADCLTGCNVGAKNSLDITYLQMVLQNGGSVRDLCEVSNIRREVWGYSVDYTDLRDGLRKSVSAGRVILSAGALNTMKILFASKADRTEGLPEISEQLGRKWGFNGDRIGLRMTPHNRLDHSYGSCLFRYLEVESDIHEFDHHFFACRSSVMDWPPWPLKALTNRVMTFLSLSREKPVGRIWKSGEVVDIYYPSQECHREATIHQKRIAMEADALVRPPSEERRERKLERIQGVRRWRGVGSVHPTGGAAMAESAERGVVDHGGRVFGYPGLYVCDASIFPVASCCGPHFFIMAHSERIAGIIVEEER